MPYITSNDGKEIWYDVAGKGEPLVLIGGSSLVHRQWDFMLPILQDHFQIILYDQRGGGLSDRSGEGVTVDQWADDLKLILDEIGIEKTHIFGTSNGSFIVVRFAAKYPERTAGIVHYGMFKKSEQLSKVSRVGIKIVEEFGVGNGSMGAYYLVRLYGIPPAFEEWETNRFEENVSPAGYKAMHEALEVDLSDDLPRIGAPQMVLIGDTGSLSMDSDYGSGWKDVKRLCSQVEVKVIQGGEGTYCVVTHPGEVAEALIDFLKRHKMGGQ